MRTLFDCVGDWFENILQGEFPDFQKVDDQDGKMPDFDHGLFSAEAKVGYHEYGAQLKARQVSKFGSNGKPTVYVIGFHNLCELKNLTAGMFEEETAAFLEERAGMHSAYFVNNQVIKRMWRTEHHTAKQNAEWQYFAVKPRHFRAVIENSSFVRGGKLYTPSSYYRIRRGDFLLQSAPLLNGRKQNLEFGAILDHKYDELIIEYLKARGKIN